ncbi:MAG: FeoA domain-containing protein, partial [Thermoanaerobaculia bacterium]|nr:FeoA domain-containing protein [Thermoanaerobaculia bacterium]
MEPRSDRPAPAPAAGVRLVQLGRGERGRMAAAELERDECQLLHALGLTDRCLLQVCKPGDPCIVQVHATRIGLSQRLAEKILVVPAEER